MILESVLNFAAAGAWWIPHLLRDAGRRGTLDDVESVAVLTGGRSRLADSLLAELFVHGALGEGEKGKLAITHRNVAVSPAGRALLEAGEPLSLAAAKKALGAHAERVAAKLQRAGLLMRDADYTRLRWLAITPLAHAGLALAVSVDYLVQVGLMMRELRRKFAAAGDTFELSSILRPLAPVGGASAVMGFAVGFASAAWWPGTTAGIAHRALVLVVLVAIGVAVYAAASLALGLPEARAISRSVRGGLAKGTGRG